MRRKVVVMRYGDKFATGEDVCESFRDKATMEDCFMEYFLNCFEVDNSHLPEWSSDRFVVIDLDAAVSHVFIYML